VQRDREIPNPFVISQSINQSINVDRKFHIIGKLVDGFVKQFFLDYLVVGLEVQ
jgi:hypothetical protein